MPIQMQRAVDVQLMTRTHKYKTIGDRRRGKAHRHTSPVTCDQLLTVIEFMRDVRCFVCMQYSRLIDLEFIPFFRRDNPQNPIFAPSEDTLGMPPIDDIRPVIGPASSSPFFIRQSWVTKPQQSA
jgi:hypothetical protein